MNQEAESATIVPEPHREQSVESRRPTVPSLDRPEAVVDVVNPYGCVPCSRGRRKGKDPLLEHINHRLRLNYGDLFCLVKSCCPRQAWGDGSTRKVFAMKP